MSPILHLDQPATYQIQVLGRLAERWSDYFDGFAIAHPSISGEATTLLTGVVADQSALHGLLNHIRDLGLPLLKVEFCPLEETQS